MFHSTIIVFIFIFIHSFEKTMQNENRIVNINETRGREMVK